MNTNDPLLSTNDYSLEKKIKYINESKKQEDEELLDEECRCLHREPRSGGLDNSKKSCCESCCECFSKSMECCFPLAICLFLLGQK